jgi:hypothetical protein
MATRRAAAASSSDPPAKAQRTESIIDALDGGGDLKALNGDSVVLLRPASTDMFIDGSGIMCGEGDDRCYVLDHVDQIDKLLPKDVKRETNCTLIDWSFLKLLPLDWYIIVFRDKATSRFRAVPEAKLTLDGYPMPRAADPEKKEGWANKEALRVVLRPNAFRFFWGGLHEPFRAADAWPTAPQVMRRGYLLEPAVRSALGAKLNAVAPSADGSWHDSFRSAVRERYWPAVLLLAAAPAVAPAAAPAAAPADAIADAPAHEAPAATEFPPFVGFRHPHGRSAADADEEPLSSRMQCILRVATSLKPDYDCSDATRATFRSRLEATGRFSPDLIDRLAAGLQRFQCIGGDACGRFGCVNGWPCDLVCACGRWPSDDADEGWGVMEGNVCSGCGMDPYTSVQHCSQCSVAMPDWRELYPEERDTPPARGRSGHFDSDSEDAVWIEPLCATCLKHYEIAS